jgi:hypothetical protein
MSSVQPRHQDHQKPGRVKRYRSAQLLPRPALSCSIVEIGDSVATLAYVIDLWQKGVNLLTRPRYQPGSNLRITLCNAAALFRHSAMGIVRTTVQTRDGTHITECEFLEELAYDQLRALLN